MDFKASWQLQGESMSPKTLQNVFLAEAEAIPAASGQLNE